MLKPILFDVIHADRPSWPTIVGCLIVLLHLYYIASIIAQYYRLRHIKGPSLAGVSKLWFLRAILRSQSHVETTAVNRQYETQRDNIAAFKGPVARIAPNDVVVSDFDRVKEILSIGSKFTRSSWYSSLRFDPFKDNVLSTRDEVQHTAYRSKLAAGYSGRDVQDLEPQIDDIISKFVTFFNRRAGSRERFDLARKVAYFTTDVISQVAFGNAFGFLESDSDLDDYLQTTQSFVPLVAISTVIETLVSLRKSRLFAAVLRTGRMSLIQYKVLRVAKRKASERFGPEKVVQKDMIGSFVAHGLSQEQLEGELSLTLLAGGETTALAIRIAILHIISDHLILAKLRAEIDSTVVSSNAPIVPEAIVNDLPYLQAVIKENLRIMPPTTGYFAKEAPLEGANLMGTFIPPGTRVNINLWGVMRQEQTWGDDAEEFRPERWLNAAPEEARKMAAALDMVFSYGKYQCLGKALAQKVLSKTIFELMRQFDLSLCYPMHPIKSVHWLTFSQKDFWVRAQRRAEN